MPEAPLSSLALYAARPTVRVNGVEQERVTGLVESLEVLEQEDGLSTLELHLGNVASQGTGGSQSAFEDEASLKLGDTLALYCGPDSAPTQVFQGMISALEATFDTDGTPKLTALAEDTLQRARMRRRTRAHPAFKLRNFAQSLAGDLGLTPKITGFNDDLGTQIQLNESDLAFLRRLLARYDGDVQVVGDELHVTPRAAVSRGTLELAFGSQLRRATVLADLAHQVHQVTVTGWDPASGQRVTEHSTAPTSDPPARRLGTSLLGRTLGQRSHQLSHLAVTNSTEAKALAEAAFAERQRRFVTVAGTAEGNPNLRVGTRVRLTALGPRFSGTYYVTRCGHRFDQESGYETDFHAEGDSLGNP